jgi:hypothetical protein
MLHLKKGKNSNRLAEHKNVFVEERPYARFKSMLDVFPKIQILN